MSLDATCGILTCRETYFAWTIGFKLIFERNLIQFDMENICSVLVSPFEVMWLSPSLTLCIYSLTCDKVEVSIVIVFPGITTGEMVHYKDLVYKNVKGVIFLLSINITCQ